MSIVDWREAQARLLDVRIGRMAVLRDWRGSDVGGATLAALMKEACGRS